MRECAPPFVERQVDASENVWLMSLIRRTCAKLMSMVFTSTALNARAIPISALSSKPIGFGDGVTFWGSVAYTCTSRPGRTVGGGREVTDMPLTCAYAEVSGWWARPEICLSTQAKGISVGFSADATGPLKSDPRTTTDTDASYNLALNTLEPDDRTTPHPELARGVSAEAVKFNLQYRREFLDIKDASSDRARPWGSSPGLEEGIADLAELPPGMHLPLPGGLVDDPPGGHPALLLGLVAAAAADNADDVLHL
jgi:hypothetical protein